MTCLIFASALTLGACSGRDKRGFSLAKSRSAVDVDECFSYLKKKKHEKAIKCFESYRSANRGSPAAGVADLAIADSYFIQKEYLSAAEMYGTFTQGYPYSEKIAYAYLQQGLSFYKAAPRISGRDQTVLDQSQQALETVIYYYKNTPYFEPASELYKKVKFRKAKKEFSIGQYYYKNKEYLAANERFKTVANDYPDSGFENDSFYYLLKGLKATNQKDLAEDYFAAYKQFFPERESQIQKLASILK